MFLTNPNSLEERPYTKSPKKYFDFKEQVEKELVGMGINQETATIACIDFRTKLIMCMKKKMTPKETMIEILPEIKRIFKYDRT